MTDDLIDWRGFIADVGPSLFRYFSMSFHGPQADDLVQETIIRLLNKVREGKFDPSRGHLRMYVFGIAHFVRIEHRRARSAEELTDEVASESISADEQMTQEEDRAHLRLAIGALSEVQQQIIGFYLDGELSLEEMGTILGMPAATVRSHLHRAKAALKTSLSPQREAKNERSR